MRADDPLLLLVLDACADVRSMEARRKELVSKAIVVPPGADGNEDFLEALTRLNTGRTAFRLPFGSGQARGFLSLVTVLGSAPKSQEDWECVQALLSWRADAKKSVARWNAVLGELGLKRLGGSLDNDCKAMAVLQELIEDTRRLAIV
jgi:hypothetical protein